MTEAPGIGGVEKDDVQVASQTAMLKAIVQQQDVALQFIDGNSSDGDAVGTLQMGHLGQVLFQNQSLIVGAGVRSVAPAEDRHLIVLAKQIRQVLDAGGLAGASGGQVANADHGHLNANHAQPARRVGGVPETDSQAVAETEQPQAEARQCRAEAARLAANQPQKSLARRGFACIG